MPGDRSRRDRVAIRTVLSQMGETTYAEIALRAGEGLASPLLEMVREGEVVRAEGVGGASSTYRLADTNGREQRDV